MKYLSKSHVHPVAVAIPARPQLTCRPKFQILFAAMLTFFLCACGASNPTLLPLVTATRAATTIPATPSPTPTPQVEIQALLLQEISTDSWRVLGVVENTSAYSVGNILIDIDLWEENKPVAHAEIGSFLPELKSGENSPFEGYFTTAASVQRASALVSADWIQNPPADSIEFDLPELFHAGTTGQWISLNAHNSAGSAVVLDKLALLVYDASGSLRDISDRFIGPLVLAPGSDSTYLFEFDHLFDQARYEVFASQLLVENGMPASTFETQITTHVDPQGKAYLLVTLSNTGTRQTPAQVVITLKTANQLLSMQSFQTPLPIPGGQQFSFTLTEFPGLLRIDLAEMIQTDEISFDIQVDAHSSQSYPPDDVLMLETRIHALEYGGSIILVQGEIINSRDFPAAFPTVFIRLFLESGDLISATWDNPSELLDANTTIDFFVSLPIPADIDPRNLEYDIFSSGIPAQAAP